MAFVIDASIAGAWLLPDEENLIAEQLMVRMADEDAWAPDLLAHEVRSILLTAERRGRIAGDVVHSALARFHRLPLRLVEQSDDTEIIRLARQYRLSAYDAAYLALALLQGFPLATLDHRLAEAASTEKVPLVEAPELRRQ
jgi:predicted nucleic acid-binding protein